MSFIFCQVSYLYTLSPFSWSRYSSGIIWLLFFLLPFLSFVRQLIFLCLFIFCQVSCLYTLSVFCGRVTLLDSSVSFSSITFFPFCSPTTVFSFLFPVKSSICVLYFPYFSWSVYFKVPLFSFPLLSCLPFSQWHYFYVFYFLSGLHSSSWSCYLGILCLLILLYFFPLLPSDVILMRAFISSVLFVCCFLSTL